MNFKTEIAKTIKWGALKEAEIAALLEAPKDEKMGDYALPCFSFSKQAGNPPAVIAAEIAASFKPSKFVERAEVAGGFLNFFLNGKAFGEIVAGNVLNNGADYFKADTGKNKVFACDFSSVNLAKHFHIGHLRNTILGEAVCRIYARLGYTVRRLNYLGDYGTPFGLMIAGYKKWGLPKDPTVSDLQALYAKSVAEKEADVDFANLGREWFKKIEAHDAEALQVYEIFKQTTLAETNGLYKSLGIEFDDYLGEFYYSQFMNDAIKRLKEAGLLKESEGAQVVDLQEFGLSVALIISGVGASLYLTRDIAAAYERYNKYKFDKFVVITGTEQILNFKQLFKILELLKAPFVPLMQHIPHGRYSLEEGKLSSRLGAKALMKDVLQEGLNKSVEILKERGAEVDASLAQDIGYGAVIFNALSNTRGKDIVWSLEKSLAFDGETGPYLQYTHARICSVLQRGGWSASVKSTPQFSELTFEQAQALKLINNFEGLLKDAAENFEPSLIARWLINIARNFNKFYNENKIVSDNPALTNERLTFCVVVKTALAEGLKILAIKPIEKM